MNSKIKVQDPNAARQPWLVSCLKELVFHFLLSLQLLIVLKNVSKKIVFTVLITFN